MIDKFTWVSKNMLQLPTNSVEARRGIFGP
jgi:hypothetical protein